MTEDFLKRKKKEFRRFQGYIPVARREEAAECNEYLESKGWTISEVFIEWLIRQVRQLKETEDKFVPTSLDQILKEYGEHIDEEVRIRAQKNKLYGHLLHECYLAHDNPKETKHLDNVLIFANELGEDYLEHISMEGKFKIAPILRRARIRAAEIANKVSQNSLPTGEK